MRNPAGTDSRSGGSGGGAKTTPCCSKVGIKRGPWTSEEDEILAGYIKREGEGQWRTLPKRAGLLRCGKSCRLRWMNYLRPHLKRGLIAPDEEDLILRLHRLLGNRWSLIAGRIPGRTDNEIKNYWNTHLSKKLISQGLDPRNHKPLETYYMPNPNHSDPGYNNNNSYHIVRSSPAQDPNPNPNSDHFPPPLPPPAAPPVIVNQEASTSYGNSVGAGDGMTMEGYSMSSHGGFDPRWRGEDGGCDGHLDSSNYNDEMFSSFLDLDSLIMNDDNQILQGQPSSSMMMMMQQPMGYESNSQGFDHYGSVWGSEVPLMASSFSNQRDKCNRNLDPAQMHKK